VYSIARELCRKGQCRQSALTRAEAILIRERGALSVVVSSIVAEWKEEGLGIWEVLDALRAQFLATGSDGVSEQARTAVLADMSTRAMHVYVPDR
jgi:hypothetical protein